MTQPTPTTPEKTVPQQMWDTIHEYRKAIISGLTSGLAALIQAWPDGITRDEWGIIIVAVLVGGGLTGIVPNKKV